MNIRNEIIKINENSYSLSQLQNIESDFVLPDYFADISKILKCTAVPFTEAVSVSGDKISVSGKIQLSLLYCGADKKLYNFESDVKYTAVFQGQNISVSDCITASQYVTGINYRALGPKRIEVKGSVQVSVNVLSLNDCEYIAEAEEDNIFTRSENARAVMPVAAAQREFAVNDVFYPDSLQNAEPQCIIRKNCKLTVNEIKPITDKIFIKGELCIDIFYLTEDDKINKSLFNIPFSEVTDLYQVREDDICIVEHSEISSAIVVKEDSDRYGFDISLNISLLLKAMREKEFSYINDIYSSSYEIKAGYKECEISCKKESCGKTFTVESEIEMYDVRGEIADSFIEGLHITQEKNSEKHLVIISGNYNALIKMNDSSYYLVSRAFTKEFDADLQSAEMYQVYNCDVLSVSALQREENKIVFRGDIYVLFGLSENRKVKMLTEFEQEEEGNDEIKARIMLYYARKNEEIWNIAKENKASILKVKEINDLQSDTLNEDKVLLLTNF